MKLNKETIVNIIGVLAFAIILYGGIILIDHRIAVTQPNTREVVEND